MAKHGYLGPKSALHLLKNARPTYPFARNNPRRKYQYRGKEAPLSLAMSQRCYPLLGPKLLCSHGNRSCRGWPADNLPTGSKLPTGFNRQPGSTCQLRSMDLGFLLVKAERSCRRGQMETARRPRAPARSGFPSRSPLVISQSMS